MFANSYESCWIKHGNGIREGNLTLKSEYLILIAKNKEKNNVIESVLKCY